MCVDAVALALTSGWMTQDGERVIAAGDCLAGSAYRMECMRIPAITKLRSGQTRYVGVVEVVGRVTASADAMFFRKSLKEPVEVDGSFHTGI